MNKSAPLLPWIEWTKRDKYYGWNAKANWGIYSVNRHGRTRLQARVNALRSVFFYRFLSRVNADWRYRLTD